MRLRHRGEVNVSGWNTSMRMLFWIYEEVMEGDEEILDGCNDCGVE